MAVVSTSGGSRKKRPTAKAKLRKSVVKAIGSQLNNSGKTPPVGKGIAGGKRRTMKGKKGY